MTDIYIKSNRSAVQTNAPTGVNETATKQISQTTGAVLPRAWNGVDRRRIIPRRRRRGRLAMLELRQKRDRRGTYSISIDV